MLDCLEHLELGGQLGAFQEELYSGVKYEVRVGEVLSDLGAGPETRVCTFTVALLTV